MPLTEYSIEKIARITGGKIVAQDPLAGAVHYLAVDSRQMISPAHSLFIALKGIRHDGHAFIPEMYAKGVVNFLVSALDEKYRQFNANFIVTDNTLDALQQLCAWHRRQFTCPVIGITGSNGKTIVKEWLFQLMRSDRNIIRSPRSYNSQLGVPLSVWPLNAEHNLAIFEAGISQPGEMDRLEKIIHPTLGILTNIGQAHDENFSDPAQKATEKLKLFASARTLIFCRDYPAISEALAQADFLPKDIRLFTWSRKGKADLQIGRIDKSGSETRIQGVCNNHFLEIKISFTDEASIENAIHCWAAMLFMGYEQEVIASRMSSLAPVAMRLELKQGSYNCSVINDSYNSDLGSLTIALDFLNQQKQHAKRTLILSDILQSGRDEESLYRDVAALATQKNITRIVGIGEALVRQSAHFSAVPEKTFFKTTEDFLGQYLPGLFRDETILLKGARAFGFERISSLLQQKAHETILEVNLNAIVHNLNYFRSKLKPGTKIMSMVKAFSYGSGSFEIANVLQFQKADYLTVAYADEGVELRRAGITLPIVVMNPEEQGLEAIIRHSLEPEIYSFRTLGLFTDALRKWQSNNPPVQLPVHIKLDTGMHRLGFEKEDINELIVRVQNSRHLMIASVFSHLAASDEPVHDGFTLDQIRYFREMSDQITARFNYPILRHILNSSGILRFPEAQLDMVRLGIGLYGVVSTEEDQRKLEHVAALKTTISQIKNVPAGDSIGYSRKALAQRNMQVATVAIGYADGYSRQLGNGAGKMLVNGRLAPVVGNVCMDMCMIDITDIPAKEGDEVIVFGKELPVTEIAKASGTIPYEILTNISHRVKRIYFHE